MSPSAFELDMFGISNDFVALGSEAGRYVEGVMKAHAPVQGWGGDGPVEHLKYVVSGVGVNVFVVLDGGEGSEKFLLLGRGHAVTSTGGKGRRSFFLPQVEAFVSRGKEGFVFHCNGENITVGGMLGLVEGEDVLEAVQQVAEVVS